MCTKEACTKGSGLQHSESHSKEAGLVLTRLALQHFLGPLGTLILHDRREVSVRPPAANEGVNVHLVEARRVERHPARLLEVEVAERRAERGLRERHGATRTLGIALCEAEGDHEIKHLEELHGDTARDALRLCEEGTRDALLARQRQP